MHLKPRCTLYVQYLYSICTFIKRTSTVHILYKYCTTAEPVPYQTGQLWPHDEYSNKTGNKKAG